MNPDSGESIDKIGIQLEYNALRSEILKRIELRQQIVSITLTLASVFLSLALTVESVALIYPPLAMFLALGWTQNDSRIRGIASYIRERLESIPISLGYETYIEQYRAERKRLGAWRFVVASHSGIFLFTQVMAVGIELSKRTSFTLIQWVLLLIDVVSILAVACITKQALRR